MLLRSLLALLFWTTISKRMKTQLMMDVPHCPRPCFRLPIWLGSFILSLLHHLRRLLIALGYKLNREWTTNASMLPSWGPSTPPMLLPSAKILPCFGKQLTACTVKKMLSSPIHSVPLHSTGLREVLALRVVCVYLKLIDLTDTLSSHMFKNMPPSANVAEQNSMVHDKCGGDVQSIQQTRVLPTTGSTTLQGICTKFVCLCHS